ncbi:MAG: hypothetical protein IJH50_11060 [Kiritimatiellae bacterium]|nr:hypothetical protein [Kiritimatiellia bacterium]
MSQSQNGRSRRFDVRIGVICDTFFYESVCSAADFVYIPPDKATWADVKGIEVLLVVSTWQGLNGNEWVGFATAGTERRACVMRLIAECRANGVKAVFYSKEDPPNFARFTEIASACEFVFTSCEEMIPKYRELCGHDRVWTMPFCVCDSIEYSGCRRDAGVDGKVIFSGSWRKKYPKRCAHLRMLFKGALKAGFPMDIYDRNSCRGKSKYMYPRKFREFVRPAVEHKDLQKIHEAAKWAININTVTSSATMFAYRVYELLAAGVNVVSNYSYGMHRLFPSVSIAYSARIAADIMGRTPDGVLELQRIVGRRDVMTGYSASKVLGELLGRIGLPQSAAGTPEAPELPSLPSPSEPLYGDCHVKISPKRRLRVAISVGSDWRGLVLATVPSLLRCERFGKFDIALRGIADDNPQARAFAEWLARDFANIHIEEGSTERSKGAVLLAAGDEVFATAFDEFAALAERRILSSVTAPEILCGRTLRFRRNGVRVGSRYAWRVRNVEIPVLCHYGDFGDDVGEKYPPKRKKSTSALQRAVACYRDNGLAKTFRRVLLGKCEKGTGKK